MSNDRNRPCYCGSGKKFKKCCGAPPAYIPIKPVGARECGPCNVCCGGWLAARVHQPGVIDHTLENGAPCPHVTPGGCGIYTQRPETPCRTFKCGWLMEGSPFPENFRPDQLGSIMVPITWQGRRAWILVPAGRNPDESLKAQMRAYTQSTGEPHMIKMPDRLLCYGVPEFQQSMMDLNQRGINPWDAEAST